MNILAIDTSNRTLAVGIQADGRALGSVMINIKKNHSVTLMPAIERLFEAVRFSPEQIDRIAVSAGPGSYTGLRIAVTTAKTLAWTLGAELVGVSSLETLAANAKGAQQLIVPLFNARRNSVYTAAYRWEKGQLKVVLAERYSGLAEWLQTLKEQKEPLLFIGETADFREQLEAAFPQSINDFPKWDLPNAQVLAALGAKRAPLSEAEVHRFLPHYLKRVEAEQKWLETHPNQGNDDYVEKV